MSSVDRSFRCSVASHDRTESLAGTASTVRALLLLECPGAWGVDAVIEGRLPSAVRQHLVELARVHRIRPLMIRRPGGRRDAGTRVFVAFVGTDRPWVQTTVLEDVASLVDLPLAGLAAGDSPGLTTYDEPLFFVCTHGKHDACCAELGRPLAAAVHAAAPEQTWEVSHIGGDRFAPNVLVLPHGLYYGRVSPSEADSFVSAHREGDLSLPHLRGRCSLPFPVQAAEIFLRAHLRLRSVEPLDLGSSTRDRDEVDAVFVIEGQRWSVRVRTAVGAPQQLTCRAVADNGPLEHSLVRIEQLPGVVGQSDSSAG